MQLRICATVAWSCSPNTLSGMFWNWGACGFSAAIAFAASAASRAKCSLTRGVTERAPDRHRPLAWALDSAVGVEASFAGHFTCTPLVWIGSVHSRALGYCRLPTQPWVRFVKLKDTLHYRKFWPECSAWMSSLDGNVLQNSSLRRASAIVESEPVGHGVLLVN